ncbi:helix-turn-helix domain-containing protein [Dialister sp. i34-0019-2H8]|uniref:helix-turn-helix domain-containing protein n=1 Tax=Dialister sp. i34-0019-2H8 TaxID=3141190 RepID=UPI0034AE011D
MRIGEWINTYRAENQLSMADFAKKTGVSKAYVGFLEKGTVNPTTKMLSKIANALGMTLQEFMVSVDDDDIITIPGASDLLPLTADEESLLSKYRRLDNRRQYAVQGYTDSKLEEQERETGELCEERIKEA